MVVHDDKTLFKACPHVRGGSLPPVTMAAQHSIPGSPSRADLHTETQLCGPCSAVLAAILGRLERGQDFLGWKVSDG